MMQYSVLISQQGSRYDILLFKRGQGLAAPALPRGHIHAKTYLTSTFCIFFRTEATLLNEVSL